MTTTLPATTLAPATAPATEKHLSCDCGAARSDVDAGSLVRWAERHLVEAHRTTATAEAVLAMFVPERAGTRDPDDGRGVALRCPRCASRVPLGACEGSRELRYWTCPSCGCLFGTHGELALQVRRDAREMARDRA